MKNWLIYAWMQGFIERLQSEAWGRTHPLNQSWNDAYDRGRGVASYILGGE